MIKHLIAITLTNILFLLPIQAHSNSSPYTLSTPTESLLIGSGLALLTYSFFARERINPLTDEEIASLSKNDINRFDRSAVNNWSPGGALLSDVILASTMAAPSLFLLNDNTRNDFMVLGVMYAESILITSAMTMTVKNTTLRNRPFVYNHNAPYKEKKDKDARFSFYSGHTAHTFNSAVFFSTVFSDYYPQSQWRYMVWGSTLLAASTVGYLRYYAGKHYPTDIIAGAMVGSLTGYIIPALHRNKNRNENISITLSIGIENTIGIGFHF